MIAIQGTTRTGKIQNHYCLLLTICVDAMMSVVWARWLWYFSEGDNNWLLNNLFEDGKWS